MNENEKVAIELMANAIRNTEFQASSVGDLPLALSAAAFDALPEYAKAAVRAGEPSSPELVTVTLPRKYWDAMKKASETALAA